MEGFEQHTEAHLQVIAPQGATNASVRNSQPSDLRLLQVDFAVRDDRAQIGWVFGTFMYNGQLEDKDVGYEQSRCILMVV